MSQTSEQSTVDEVFAQGLAAYRRGEAAQAEANFRWVTREDPSHGKGWLYMGLLAVAAKRWGDARESLTRALDVEPSNSIAWHYLGQTLEMSDDVEGAIRCYSEAVRSNPQADGSRTALRRLESTVERVQSPDANGRSLGLVSVSNADIDTGTGSSVMSAEEMSGSSPYGVYEVLAASTDPLVRQPLLIMDNLRTKRRPRLSAFGYRYLAGAVAGIFVGYIVAQFLRLREYFAGRTDPIADVSDVALWSLVAALLIVAWQVALAATTEYSIDKGRLQILSGIIVRRRTNIELYRVVNVLLTQNLIQRVTADGTLVLNTSDRSKTRVIGLARVGQLHTVWQQLLNLVFALRGNNYVRGIIS